MGGEGCEGRAAREGLRGRAARKGCEGFEGCEVGAGQQLAGLLAGWVAGWHGWRESCDLQERVISSVATLIRFVFV